MRKGLAARKTAIAGYRYLIGNMILNGKKEVKGERPSGAPPGVVKK